MSENLIQGTPTKSGKITYLYYDENNNIVSLLQQTAIKKGFKPVLEENNIDNEIKVSEDVVELNKEEILPIINISIKDELNYMIKYHKLFEIYNKGNLLFSSKNSSVNKLILNDEFFIVYGIKYYYNNGIRLKKIN